MFSRDILMLPFGNTSEQFTYWYRVNWADGVSYPHGIKILQLTERFYGQYLPAMAILMAENDGGLALFKWGTIQLPLGERARLPYIRHNISPVHLLQNLAN